MVRIPTSMLRPLLFAIPIMILLIGCIESRMNVDLLAGDSFKAKQIPQLPEGLLLHDTIYVPVYSDIYSRTKDVRFNLTATLSLRNTSLHEPMYISAVDYYNSSGDLIRSFLKKPVQLDAMQSIEYVIEEADQTGGTGANFLITWAAASTQVVPLFESVMISTNGQQGISFTSRGVSISRK